MKFPTRLSALAVLLLTVSSPLARAQAPAAPVTRDVQMFENGIALAGEGKFAEAIQSFQEIITRFPTSPAVPQAHFRVGYTYYLAADYDKAVEAFEKLPTVKPAPDAVTLEIAAGMIPQILVAKASKLPPEGKEREVAFADAAAKFDAFIAKYPNSREVESANYSKAVALYQIARYDEAVTALRGNLTKFAQSPTILDSQYLLGLTLGTIANLASDKATAPDPAIGKNYDEAERVLRDIVAKGRDIALLNDSQFQIGELLFSRGSHLDEKAKPAMMQRALESYRSVYPKATIVNAQKIRVEQFRQLSKQAGMNRDFANRDALQRIADKEQEKIAILEARPDQTVTAKLKSGMIFFQLSRADEARVVFNFIEPFAEDEDTKKQLLYFTTLTYAVQGNVAKAVEKYEAFQAAHKGDPIAENLDLVIGGMFLTPGKEYTNAEKAIELLQRGLETYPNGRYTAELLMQKSMAEVQIGKFDEALKSFTDFLAKNPAKELAVAAEYGIGIVHMKTDKTAEAVKTFTEVRDKYPGTEQAEDAAFYVGHLQLATDVKTAMTELKSFIEKHPDSRMLPEALYALGQSQLTTGDPAAAFQSYEQLVSKHPDSAPAPFSYFDRARHLAGEQKFDEVTALMKEFMEKYKENDALYQAYDFVAQIQTSQGKGAEAIATYEEFVEAKPEHPTAAEALVKLGALWKGYAESQGPYLALDETKRAEWTKGVEKSLAASERIVANFPEHAAVATALNNMLAVLRLQQRVRIKTAADVEAYFTALLDQAKENPNLVSKITFAVSGFIAEQDKAKALTQMESVYREELRYGAEELDLFGRSLIENKRYDEAVKIYDKIETDYKAANVTDPTKAPRETQEALAIALFGKSKVLQEQAAALKAEGKADEAAKKTAEAGALAEQLKKFYGWSKYALEANFPQAQSLHEQKKDDEAMKLLIEVIKAKDATPELRARSMLLLGKIHQANGRNENAIDNYMKIAAYYGAVADVAAEGLWLGAQLLEKQSTGEIPMPTPPPKAAPKEAAK